LVLFSARKKEQEGWSLVIGHWSLVIGKEAEKRRQEAACLTAPSRQGERFRIAHEFIRGNPVMAEYPWPLLIIDSAEINTYI